MNQVRLTHIGYIYTKGRDVKLAYIRVIISTFETVSSLFSDYYYGAHHNRCEYDHYKDQGQHSNYDNHNSDDYDLNQLIRGR